VIQARATNEKRRLPVVGNGATIRGMLFDERKEAEGGGEAGIARQHYGELLWLPLCSGYLADADPSRDMGQASSDTCRKFYVDSWEASHGFHSYG